MCNKMISVAGRQYERLSQDQPYFLGRWFEKEVDGILHMTTTTDGALIYFLLEGCTSFDLHFTDITHIRTPYFAYSIDGSEPVRQLITAPTVRLHDTDRSAWWALLFLIPFIGWLIIIVFNCQAGTPGENRFGPDPKLEP